MVPQLRVIKLGLLLASFDYAKSGKGISMLDMYENRDELPCHMELMRGLRTAVENHGVVHNGYDELYFLTGPLREWFARCSESQSWEKIVDNIDAIVNSIPDFNASTFRFLAKHIPTKLSPDQIPESLSSCPSYSKKTSCVSVEALFLRDCGKYEGNLAVLSHMVNKGVECEKFMEQRQSFSEHDEVVCVQLLSQTLDTLFSRGWAHMSTREAAETLKYILKHSCSILADLHSPHLDAFAADILQELSFRSLGEKRRKLAGGLVIALKQIMSNWFGSKFGSIRKDAALDAVLKKDCDKNYDREKFLMESPFSLSRHNYGPDQVFPELMRRLKAFESCGQKKRKWYWPF